MTGAMYAAIAGLKAHMSKLNVISNNVANVNTYGYKSQRAVFSDAIYTTKTSGTNGTATAAGRNPSQIGYGVEMTSVDIDMSTGTFAPTGKDMDCMIYGDGFFMVGDKDVARTITATDPNTLKSLTLTRVGNIEFKEDGYLANNDNMCVYGFQCIGMVDGEPIFSDQLVPIRYPKAQTVIEKQPVYDDDGLQVYETDETGLYKKTDGTTFPEGTTYEEVAKSGEGVPQMQDVEVVQIRWPEYKQPSGRLEDVSGPNGTDLPFLPMDSVSIDKTTGRISAITKDSDTPIVIGVIAIGNVTNPNGVSHVDGPYYKALDGAGDLSVSLIGGIEQEMYISGTVSGENLGKVPATVADPESNDPANPDVPVYYVKDAAGNYVYENGKIKEVIGTATPDANGNITYAPPDRAAAKLPDGTDANLPEGYTCDEAKMIDGKIATFIDDGTMAKGISDVNGGLLQDGEEAPEGMRVTSAGTTKLQTGGLEASKADLATEISEMITTQRGYQANTRIVTVTDSMLEELVNMKR